MKLLDRLLRGLRPAALSASCQTAAGSEQPAMPRLAEPLEPECGLDRVASPAPAAVLSRFAREATLNGIKVFPITVLSRHAPAAGALLALATADVEALSKNLPANTRDASTAWPWEAGSSQSRWSAAPAWPSLNRSPGLQSSTETRTPTAPGLLAGGNSRWALYLAPSGIRTSVRVFGNGDLKIVGPGSWIPAPGSTFMGVSYAFRNPGTRIASPPPLIAALACGDRQACDRLWRLLEFSALQTE